MIRAIRNFFDDPFIVGATGVLLLVTGIIVAAFVLSPSASDREGRVYKTSEVFTVEHDDHLFVVFDGYREGGIIHHPTCTHIECAK